jgi:hypothetical protein
MAANADSTSEAKGGCARIRSIGTGSICPRTGGDEISLGAEDFGIRIVFSIVEDPPMSLFKNPA